MEITKEDEKKFAILYERYMEKKNKEEFEALRKKEQVNKKLRLNGYLITKIEHIPAIAGERRMFFISLEGTRGTFMYEDELLEQLKGSPVHVQEEV